MSPSYNVWSCVEGIVTLHCFQIGPTGFAWWCCRCWCLTQQVGRYHHPTTSLNTHCIPLSRSLPLPSLSPSQLPSPIPPLTPFHPTTPFLVYHRTPLLHINIYGTVSDLEANHPHKAIHNFLPHSTATNTCFIPTICILILNSWTARQCLHNPSSQTTQKHLPYGPSQSSKHPF